MRNYRLICGLRDPSPSWAMSKVFDVSTPTATSDVHTTVVAIILSMNPGGTSAERTFLMREITTHDLENEKF